MLAFIARLRSRNSLKLNARAVGYSALLLLAACSNGNDHEAVVVTGPQGHAVGTTTRTFVDTSRPTAAHGTVPETSSRTLPTVIVYPAEGTPGVAATPEAPVDRRANPYPLVVLSHGLGGVPEYLIPIAKVWAARGYVVAIPRFPLTNATTPGGPAAQDVQNQPADVSFIIDQMLAESQTEEALLRKAVDGDRIAVSGHSNGGVTTYGVAANTCCRDPRIGAAVILSGVAGPYIGGEYDFANAPPMLVLHGVRDVQLDYNQAVRTYNELLPPKGFLSLDEADHTSYLAANNPAFAVSAITSADFLDAQLRDDATALQQLAAVDAPGIATMHWAPDDASNIPLAPLPEPETNRQASVSDDSDLTDGQVITVSWSGFLPGKVVNIMQCAGEGRGSATCNISGGKILQPDPTGFGSLDLVIHTGPIGNGVCDSANPCTVLVNDASLIEDEATVRIPITLAE